MRGKTDGRDASPTVRVRFRLPVGDVRETAGRGGARGVQRPARVPPAWSRTWSRTGRLRRASWRGDSDLARGVLCWAAGVGRGGRVTSLHGDVLRGIHQLALTKGAGGPLRGRLRPRRRWRRPEGLFVCLFICLFVSVRCCSSLTGLCRGALAAPI